MNIDKGYDMTDFHDKKMVPNNGLGFICTSSIAQTNWYDHDKEKKKKITLVAGTHRFLLKNSTIKKDLMVPLKFLTDKHTVPAVYSHMEYCKRQCTRVILFSGLDLLPVAEPFKPFMLARTEAATSLAWSLTGYAIAMCTNLESCLSGGLMDLFPYNSHQESPHDMDALRALVAEVLVPFDETSLLTLEDSKYTPCPSLSRVDWSPDLNDIDKLHLRVHMQAVQPSMDVSLLLSLSLIDCGLTDNSLNSLFGAEAKYFTSFRSASKKRPPILLRCLRKLSLSRNELTSMGLIKMLSSVGDDINSDRKTDEPRTRKSSESWGLRGLRELDLSYNRLLNVYVKEGASVKGELVDASKVAQLVTTLPLVFPHLAFLNLAGNLLGGLPSGLEHVPNNAGVPFGLIYRGVMDGKTGAPSQDIPTSIVNAVASAIYTRARIVAKYDHFLHSNTDFSAEDIWKPPFLSVNLNDNNFPNDRLPFQRLLASHSGNVHAP